MDYNYELWPYVTREDNGRDNERNRRRGDKNLCITWSQPPVNPLLSDIDNGAKRALFESVVDTAPAELIEYRDIAPRATTLNKLRNGKTRRTAVTSRRQLGTARILSRQVLNETLKKFGINEAAKREREKTTLGHKGAIEAKKCARQALEQQWKLEYAR